MSTTTTDAAATMKPPFKVGKIHSIARKKLSSSSRSKSSPALMVQNGSINHPSGKKKLNQLPHCHTLIDLTVLKGNTLIKAVQTLITNLFQIHVRHIHLDRVSGALTNAVFFVTINHTQKMLLRVYGVGCDQLLDRNKELNWLSHLSQLNIGPKMLGTFGNGRFEEYLPSTTLTSHDIRDARVSAQIASRLHQLHSIVQIFPPDEGFDESLNVWTMIERWYTTLLDILPRLKAIYPDLNLDAHNLRKQIDACKEFLGKSNSPIVFAHNDAQYGNILKINGTDELVVIDFEYAGYNPRAYDIVNHFCEWMYDYHSTTHSTSHMEEERYPSKEEQFNFLSSYLNHTQDQKEVEALYEEVNQWRMASHLFWCLWGFVQASQSEIEFDYYAYSMQRLAAFKKDLAYYTSVSKAD